MENNHERNNECCLENVLRVIDVLQKNADKCDRCDESCKRPFLGNLPNVVCFNTRPITLYSCNTNEIETDYRLTLNGTTTTGTSNIYRVEEVNSCCVTCCVLAPNPDTTEANSPYVKSDTFITFDLDCIGAIRCLPDVIINNC